MRVLIAVMVVLFLTLTIIPAYAADKRAENNKNIASFILDTIKLPYVLLGSFVKQDHEQAKKDVNYEGHQGIKKCLR